MMPNQRTLPDHRKLTKGDMRMGPNRAKILSDESEPADNLREEAREGLAGPTKFDKVMGFANRRKRASQ